jgi:hypothetical protein
MDIIAGSKSWQVPRFDIASVRNTTPLLRSPAARPGGRLVSALMGLANEDPTGTLPRANDAARSAKRAARNVPGLGTVSAFKRGVVTSLEHLFNSTTNGNDFRRAVAERLVEGTDDERDLATLVMGRAGFADSTTMKAVIDRLFAIGVMTEEVDPDADPLSRNKDLRMRGLRRDLRRQIRRDAVASLMRLASLIDPKDPANLRDPQDPTSSDPAKLKANRVIGDLVADRAAALMEDRAAGFAGYAEETFFESVRSMRLNSSRPLERYSAKFEEAFNRHLTERIRDATKTKEEADRLSHLLREHMRGPGNNN